MVSVAVVTHTAVREPNRSSLTSERAPAGRGGCAAAASENAQRTPVRAAMRTRLRRRRHPLSAAEHRGEREPSHRKQNEQIGEVPPVQPIRPVRLGRDVQRFAVGKDIGFGELMEAVYQELDDEYEQEHGGDLEKQSKV